MDYYGAGEKDQGERGQGDKEGKQLEVIWTNASSSASDLTIYTLPATIHTIQDNSGTESQHINARALLDSGALSRDLVSQKTVNSIIDSLYRNSNNARCSSCVKKFTVYSGLDGHCTNTNDIELVINLTSEIGEHLTIRTRVLADTPFDVILGLETLRASRLVSHFQHYFGEPLKVIKADNSDDNTSRDLSASQARSISDRPVEVTSTNEDIESSQVNITNEGNEPSPPQVNNTINNVIHAVEDPVTVEDSLQTVNPVQVEEVAVEDPE